MHIMEGNPRDPFLANHQIIYTNKTMKCYALTLSDDKFFYMD